MAHLYSSVGYHWQYLPQEKKQVASFLLARLNPELSRAICCISVWYTWRLFPPSLSLSCKVNASNAPPAKLHVNINCPAVRTKGFAINGNADDGVLIASSKYSSCRFSQDRPNWFPNSSLLNSAFCWVAQCRCLPDTPRSSSFRHLSSSFVVSRAIHQGRAVFLAAFLSRGSNVTCFPMSWCCVESHSLRMSTSPRLSTSRTPPHNWLLGFEVILRFRSRRGFHFPQKLG